MWKVLSVFALLVSLCACGTVLADNPRFISLSSSEKAKAMELLERRQAAGIKRAKLAAQYAADSDRVERGREPDRHRPVATLFRTEEGSLHPAEYFLLAR